MESATCLVLWSLNHVNKDLASLFQAELLLGEACGHGVCIVLRLLLAKKSILNELVNEADRLK